MRKDVVKPHTAQQSENQEARDQRQRNPVGNRHGEEVARGGERHQGRKQQKPCDVEDHGKDHGMTWSVRLTRKSEHRPNLSPINEQSENGRPITRPPGFASRAQPAPASAPGRPVPRAHRRDGRSEPLLSRHRFYASSRHHDCWKQRRPRNVRGLRRSFETVDYFSEELIEVNLVFRLLPRPFTVAIIASAMPAAIRPYSMAVAPDSSFTKRAIRFCITISMCTRGWSNERLVSPAFSAP